MSTFLSILPIIIALVLYFTGIPIAYALFAAALTYFGFIDTTTVPYLLMQKFITSTQSFPCLLYTSPSPRDSTSSRMPSSA